jgi:hypothetical protein
MVVCIQKDRIGAGSALLLDLVFFRAKKKYI